MAKQKEKIEDLKEITELKVKVKKNGFLKKLWKFLFSIFVVAIFILTIFIVLQHPKVKEYYTEILTGKERMEIAKLNNELSILREDLNKNTVNNNNVLKLNENLKILAERYKILEENNLNTIRSKADVALVLGIIGRLDNIENKVTEVAKVSDKGALIAMAVGLVKDACERGGDYTYELSVLDQLTKDELSIRSYVEVLNKYSKEVVYNEYFLSSEFEKIYKLAFAEEEILDDADWKAKFNKRFGKIMTIKHRKASENQDIEELNLDRALYFIKNGEFNRAVEELNRDKYVPIVGSNPELKDWLYFANSRIEFTSALSKISAYSLAVMKVNEFNK